MKDNNNGKKEEKNLLKPKWQGFNFYSEKSATTEGQENITEDIEKSLPLVMAKPRERLLIYKLKGSEEMVRRLIALGLVPGCELQIISTTGTSVIVGIGDNRIGLGFGMARKIICTYQE